MIPFDLFKYIYLRNIIYDIIFSSIFGIIFYSLLNISIKLGGNASNILSSVILLILPIFIIFMNKFILNKLIFTKYKNITIQTDLKTISIKFIIMFFLITKVALCIPYLGFVKIIYLIFNNNIISSILCCIIGTFMGYYTTNLFLSKYITVIKNDNIN